MIAESRGNGIGYSRVRHFVDVIYFGKKYKNTLIISKKDCFEKCLEAVWLKITLWFIIDSAL
jgi:hypothetical protein